MSRNIWFFSDHHFSHANILNFKDKDGNLIRPMFSDVDEMDDYMVEIWNENIKQGDIVWHLGDITFNQEKFVTKILNKLHGKLRITVGNHDDLKFLARLGRFEKVVESRRFDDMRFVASHRQLHNCNLWNHRKQWEIANVTGHIHQNDPPEGPYINVCVERTNYKPVHIEDVAAQVKKLLEK